jgi:hypothetical protein
MTPYIAVFLAMLVLSSIASWLLCRNIRPSGPSHMEEPETDAKIQLPDWLP